jgi:tetratricopeptide (TPR) repeat protein|tara:strand:+ start:416 stop:877 length:462 start_codon:yes stop_codon:yes gene_type:complete
MKTIQQQAVIFIIAFALIFILYQLPKNVVEGDDVQGDVVAKTTSIESAISLLEGSNPMEGVFMLRDIVEKEPNNIQAIHYLGDLSLQTGQYENAIKRFNQILSIDSSDKKTYLQLGISYYGLNDYNKADSLFQIVRDLNDSTLIRDLNIFLMN